MNNTLNILSDKLQSLGHKCFIFETSDLACDYLCSYLKNKNVSFGGSVTLQGMGLYEKLIPVCKQVNWHWKNPSNSNNIFRTAFQSDAYLLSANAISLTGEIVNMDGNGNRIAASIFGPKEVIFIIGKNKITSDLTSAIDRVRNIAAPMNAKRLNKKTPCALDGKCHNCMREDCFCSIMSIHRRKPASVQTTIILINENLGF